MADTAIALGGGSLGSGIHSREKEKKAERQSERLQRQANRVQKATAAVERSISRRKAVAEARRRQASNIAEGANIGIVGSSPLQGAQASIASQLATGFASEQRSFVSGQQTFDLRQQAASTLAAGRREAEDIRAISGFTQQAGQAAVGFI